MKKLQFCHKYLKKAFLDFIGLPQSNDDFLVNCNADLEKTTSHASGACGHFVGNQTILRTFCIKYPILLAEDGGRRVEEGELRLDKGDLRWECGYWRILNSKLRMEGYGLMKGNQDQHLIYVFLFILYRNHVILRTL